MYVTLIIMTAGFWCYSEWKRKLDTSKGHFRGYFTLEHVHVQDSLDYENFLIFLKNLKNFCMDFRIFL